MWGTDSSKQLRLTVPTSQEYQEEVLLDALPQIFCEALRITRYLGFKYL
jgi:hypothetical protein